MAELKPAIPIPPEDVRALKEAYGYLLENRDLMVGVLSKDEQSAYRREVMVDGIIAGAVKHLHEVASQKETFRERIRENGRTFPEYASRHVGQVVFVFKQLQAKLGESSPSPAPSSPPKPVSPRRPNVKR